MSPINRRLLPAIVALAPLLLLASFACNNQSFGAARIDSLEISPTNGSGSFTITVAVISGTGSGRLKCEVPGSDNPSRMETRLEQEISGSSATQPSPQIFVDQFYLTKPGAYRVTCTVGEQTAEASFSVSLDRVDESSKPVPTATARTATTAPPQNTTPEPAPADTSSGTADAGACSRWNISGTWKLTQSNNYHPQFILMQQGESVFGSASLPPDEQARAGFSAPNGTVLGKVSGNEFTAILTWSPRNSDHAVLSATYKATITQGHMEGKVDPNDSWSADGPTKCTG